MHHHKWLAFAVAVILATGPGTLSIRPAHAAPTAGTAYTWTGATSTDWQVATNWSPARTAPLITDILLFNGGGAVTVTNVPTQQIGQLLVSNSTAVSLATAAANSIIISGDAGTDLDVPGGSALNMNGAAALTISVSPGATGSISGGMTCRNGASRLTASDAGAITFNSGAIFTQASGCIGNVFTTVGTPNVIVFASGSTFVSQAGANPFGLTQPNSKVVFQGGSLYRHEQTATPSFSGRTYANFELNYGAANISGTGTSGLSIDDLVVAAGTLHLGMTGGNAFNLRGDVSVAAGATLDFNPASAGTLRLDGLVSQSIGGAGTLTFGANENVLVANAAGVTLLRNVALGGGLTINAGARLDAGGNTVTAETAFANNGTFVQTLDVSAGTRFLFVRNAAATTTLYYGVIITPTASMGSTTVTIKGNQTAGCTSNSGDPLIHRCFSIDPTTPQTADIQFYYTEAERNSQNASQLRAVHYVYPNWLPVGISWVRSESGTTCVSGGGNACWMRADGVTSYSAFGVGTAAVAYPSAVKVQGGQVVTPNAYALAGSAALALAGLLIGAAALRRQRR